MPPRRSAVRESPASPRGGVVSPEPPAARGKAGSGPAAGKRRAPGFFGRHGNVYLYVPNLIGVCDLVLGSCTAESGLCQLAGCWQSLHQGDSTCVSAGNSRPPQTWRRRLHPPWPCIRLHAAEPRACLPPPLLDTASRLPARRRGGWGLRKRVRRAAADAVALPPGICVRRAGARLAALWQFARGVRRSDTLCPLLHRMAASPASSTSVPCLAPCWTW